MSKRSEYRRKEREARDRPSQSRTTMWIAIGGIALLTALLLALLLTRPAIAPSAAGVPEATRGIPNPEVGRIPLAEARNRLDQPGVIFVDVRSAQEFAESHITGAVNIPLPEIPTRMNELPQTAEIITYCT